MILQLLPECPLPVLISLAPYGRAALSGTIFDIKKHLLLALKRLSAGLLDVGDLLYSVDKTPVKALQIPAIVHLIVGPENSRVTLEVFRRRALADILPPPVVIAPFARKEIVLQRRAERHASQNGTAAGPVAGIGIRVQKVPAPARRPTHRGARLLTTESLHISFIVVYHR